METSQSATRGHASASGSPSGEPGPAPIAIGSRGRGPRPSVRLFTEPVTVDHGLGPGPRYEELSLPLLELSFVYGEGRVWAGDERDSFLFTHEHGVGSRERDPGAESRARYVLESFGAVEIGCLEQLGTAPDSRADYVIRVDGDLHDYCAFSAYVVPQLVALGWEVVTDEAYPYRVVGDDPPFYAKVTSLGRLSAGEARSDWFGLELGLLIGGARVDLLPILLDLIEKNGDDRGLGGLANSSARCFALPVVTGYAAIPKERLQAILKVLVELYRGPGARRPCDDGEMLAFEARPGDGFCRLERAIGREIEGGASRALRERAEAFAKPLVRTPVPSGLLATLRPYQEEGLAFLQRLVAHEVGGVLADDMGLGKTLETIAHFLAEKRAGRLVQPALVVAPTSLVFNWERELAKFAPELEVVALVGPGRNPRYGRVREADVVVTSYPILVRDIDRLAAMSFHLLVLDEAQSIKNSASLSHRAVCRIDAHHRLCLTGTPVENHLGELHSLFEFLNPGMLGGREHFQTWFRGPIERDGDDERLDALRDQLKPFILRRLKSEVAKDLPPKTELLRPAELSGKQRELYESIRVAAHSDVRRAIRTRGLAASSVSILDALMKLRQLCCDPRLLRLDAARFVRESAKYELLFDLLDRQLENGHRVLIFSQFTSMLRLIAKGLDDRGARYSVLTGQTRDRRAAVDRFESGERSVFLISLKAGGTGLTLTSADTVIHYDPWWNPAVQAQATDRAYRIGQTKPVFVYNLFIAGSVEERMIQLQRRKQLLADSVLGLERNTPFTEQDIDTLFAPLSV